MSTIQTERLEDYLTGKSVPATPEEYSRQEILRRLHEDYGYPKELMVTEFGVKKSPSDTRRTVPVDIAVFETEEDLHNRRAKIFVETKRPHYQEGREQLHDYLSFEQHVSFGIWFNGSQDESQSIAFYRKDFHNNEPRFQEITDIPRYGFSDTTEQITRTSLQPTNNLKSIFKTLRGYLAANATGTTRDEDILNQLVMLIIAKLYDERYREGHYVDFRVVNNDEKQTREAVELLLEEARTRWRDVFATTDTLSLDNRTLQMIVGQLQHYSLEKSSRNVISEAFESIISYATKGSQGQFFTPKNVVDLMVHIANPGENKTVFDPANGTAGFLISSMFHVWEQIDSKDLAVGAKNDMKKDYAGNFLYGIEKDAFLSKIAKAYMAVLGDGRTGLFVEDSLNETYWSSATQAHIQDKQFDYILTNPPFGKDIKLDKETEVRYKFGKDIELAFVEKALEHLKDGGTLGVILPETIFHGSSRAKARQEFFFSHNITHIIDLPHDTFRPFNNAKCDIIFLQKNTPQQDAITVIKVDDIGHNHLGKEKFRFNTDSLKFTTELADDIPSIIEQLESGNWDYAHIRTVPANAIKERDLLVARPYFVEPTHHSGLVTLGQLIDEGVLDYFSGHGSPQSHLKGLGTHPYIRVKDIVNLEIAHNRLDDIPEEEFLRLRGKTDGKKPKLHDIVFVRRGSYRIGDVGIVYEKDLDSVYTGEISTFRVMENNLGITPFNLLGMLNSDEVRQQFNNLILMDTTLPNIGERWKDTTLDISDREHLKMLSNRIEEMVKSRANYWDSYSTLFGVNG